MPQRGRGNKTTISKPQPFSQIFNLDIGLPQNDVPQAQGLPPASLGQSRGRRKSTGQSGAKTPNGGRGKVILQPITTPEPKRNTPGGSVTPSRGRGHARGKGSPLAGTGAKRLPSGKKVLPEINKYECLVLGNLDNLPSPIPSVVRIFLSSTFSDFRTERNALVHRAYPALREFCLEHGLQFQIMDLRWGITDDVANDHMVEALCRREIQTCQRLSLGPNFVTMLGNRYGYLPLPAAIPASEFDILIEVGKTLELDTSLLTSWYLRDDNAVPSEYVLQPINKMLLHFTDHSPENEEKQKEASATWKETSAQLRELIEKLATKASADSLISEEDCRKYLRSVTHDEIQCGIMNTENPVRSAVCFVRDFDGHSLEKDDPAQWRYFNVKEVEGQLVKIEDVDGHLEKLKRNVLPSKFGSAENIVNYKIPWIPGGVNCEDGDHKKYLGKFCDDFVKQVKRLVEGSMNEVDEKLKKMASFSVKLSKNTSVNPAEKWPSGAGKNLIPGNELFLGNFQLKNIISELNAVEKSSDTVESYKKKLFAEILHHSLLCKERCESFHGREGELEVIRNYFRTGSKKPLVVHAECGVGKTAFMAMAHKASKEIFKTGCTVTRFLGTSPESSRLLPLLTSVCEHTCVAYGEIVNYSELQRLNKAIEYFHNLLAYISVKYGSQRPLVLVLDSVDQLCSSQNAAHTFKWLPRICPQHVKIVVSTLPDDYDCLKNAETHFESAENFIKLEKLPPNAGLAIVHQMLEKQNRKLTDKQMKLISDLLTQDCHPLLLRLSINHAITWKSYEMESQIQLQPSISGVIEMVFGKLEEKYGKVFVSKALGYLTVSLNGLSEIELEDVLSCDDAVLDDVYRYHDPPIEGVVRIPPLMWARLRYDLKEYVTERTLVKQTIIAWYYRQFKTVALDKYVTADDKRALHGTLASMYAAESSVKRTVHLSHRKLTINDADRVISVQPYSANNVGKLLSIAHHAVSSEEETIKQSLMVENLPFIYNLCRALNLTQRRTKAQETLEYLSEVNQLLADVVAYCGSTSGKSSDKSQRVYMTLSSSLLPYCSKYPEMRNLCNRALEELTNTLNEVSVLPITGIVNHGEVMKWAMESSLSLIRVDATRNLAVMGQVDYVEKKPLLQIADCTRGLVVHSLDRNRANGVSQDTVVCAKFGNSTDKVFALLKTKVIVWDYLNNTVIIQSNDVNKKGALNTGLLTSRDDHYLILYNCNRMVMFEHDQEQYKVKRAMDLGGSVATTNMMFSRDLNLTVSSHTIKSKGKDIGAVVYWDFWGEKLQTRVALPAPVLTGGLYNFTPLGQTDVVLTCLTDGSLFLVDVPDGTVLKRVGNTGLSSQCLSTCYDPNTATVCVGLKDTIKVWDLDKGSEIQDMKLENNVTSLRLDLEGNLVSAQDNGTVTVFNSSDFAKIHDRCCHRESISHLFHLDDGTMVTCGSGRSMAAWDMVQILHKGEEDRTEKSLPFISVADCGVTTTGDIVTVNEDGESVKAWSAENGNEVSEVKGSASRVEALKSSVLMWQPNGRVVGLWDMTNPVKQISIEDDLTAIASGADDSFIVLLGGSTFTLYESTGDVRKTFKTESNFQNVTKMRYSPESQLIIVESSSGVEQKSNGGNRTLSAIDLDTANEGQTYNCDNDKFNCSVITAEGTIYLGLQGKICVWTPKENASTSNMQTLFNGKGKEEQSAVTWLAACRVYAVAGSKAGNVFVLKLGAASSWEFIGSHKSKVTDGSFFDDDTLVTSSLDGTVYVWNLQERQLVNKFHLNKPVTKVMTGNNGTIVVMTTKMEDKRISVWKVMNSKS